MTLDKKQQLKIVVYLVLLVGIIVGGYYYYNFLQVQPDELEQVTEQTRARRLDGKKLETDVLEQAKFKELKPIVVEEGYLEEGATTTTAGELTDEEVARVPRRHANPFKPF